MIENTINDDKMIADGNEDCFVIRYRAMTNSFGGDVRLYGWHSNLVTKGTV